MNYSELRYFGLLVLLLLPVLVSNVYGEEYEIINLDSLLVNSTGWHNSLVKIDSGVTVLAHETNYNAGYITTFDISTNGIISELDSLEHDSGSSRYLSLVQVDSDTVALAHSHSGSGSYIKTFDVAADGTITQVDSLEHDTGATITNSFIKLDSGIFALVYDSGDEIIKTFDITNNGIITQIQSLSHENSGTTSYHSIVQVDSGIVVISYRGASDDLKTFSISADGSVITELDSFNHESGTVFEPSLVQVDSDTVALAFYQAVTADGYLKTFDIASNGTITQIQSLNHGEDVGSYNSLIEIDVDTFALAHAKYGVEGYITVFNISGDGFTITELTSEIPNLSIGHDNSLIPITSDLVALATTINSTNFINTFNVTTITSLSLQEQLDIHTAQIDALQNSTAQNTADISSLQSIIDSLILHFQNFLTDVT